MTRAHTSRFAKRFELLKQRNEGAFLPFVTLGDPDFETSLEILKTLIKNGADALELGFPFSDPCADGMVIQEANHRALDAGVSTKQCFELIRKLREYDKEIPISILSYSNLAVAHGVASFYQDAYDCGIDAVLLPDIPLCMLDTHLEFRKHAREAGIDLVLLAPPNADNKTLHEIAKTSQGYTYMLSRFGITGTDHRSGRPQEVMQALKKEGAAPVVLGFGISEPEQVHEALEAGADGIVVGSAIVKIIARTLSDKSAMLQEIATYVKSIKAATKN